MKTILEGLDKLAKIIGYIIIFLLIYLALSGNIKYINDGKKIVNIHFEYPPIKDINASRN